MVAPDRQFDSLRRVAAGRFAYLSRSVVATWVTAMAFIAILFFGWMHGKATIEQQLREHVLAMAQLAADRTALSFDSVAKALQTIGDGLGTDDLEPAQQGAQERRLVLQTMLIRARGRNPSVVSLVITDAAGHTLAASPYHADGASSTIRPKDIPPLSQDDRDTPAISAPFRDPASGIWLVRMTHRISGSSGLTSGMLLANVAIDEALGRIFQQYPIAGGDMVSLHDPANRLLASFPPMVRPEAARTEDGPGIGNASAESLDESVRYVTAPAGDVVRLVATRKLSRYPFYVSYGQSVDAWLLKWRQEQFVLAIASLAALIVTAAITTGIQRRLALTGQLQKVRGDLEETNVALRATLAAAEMLAARDQLTGLCNRRNFDQRLEAAIARATRHGDVFSLLMLDIDHFKNVNDYYGHATGDDVLRRFGEVLSERLRPYDVAARWGGEEFVVLADGATLDNARMLAEQIRESVASTPFSPVPRVTVSIGIADYMQGESGDDLLRRADKALYGAKRNGRNRVIAAESGQTSPMLRRQSA
ncbi:MAG: GGDEF domain-containing protein [Rhodocyclales bacterium]|nr:GGDEF domain-containing protein [Rhodocyclales bacterium]